MKNYYMLILKEPNVHHRSQILDAILQNVFRIQSRSKLSNLIHYVDKMREDVMKNSTWPVLHMDQIHTFQYEEEEMEVVWKVEVEQEGGMEEGKEVEAKVAEEVVVVD